VIFSIIQITDVWLLDNGERIRPTTPWKAYCGFTQEELDQLTLAIGDSCNSVEGVELSSKEANVHEIKPIENNIEEI
tara:strand:- start:21 stop:251 length:231 start_codon:yes stop_codon:yes gene_type:complete